MRALGVFCSDLHLSSTTPGCRGDDWMAAQSNMLECITKTAKKMKCPVFVSGDIFHKSKEDPAAVSLAIRWMKKAKWYGIPGQHDLPGHSLLRIEESSFWNLVEAGVLEYIEGVCEFDDFYAIGHPYGTEPVNAEEMIGQKDKKVIGLAHQLVYENKPFPDAPESGNVKTVTKKYKGYHVLAFGDNHIGFTASVRKGRGSVVVINSGVACRRTRAEIEYKPRCYVLFDDMTVKPKFLPFKDDVILDDERKVHDNDRLHVFVETLMRQTEVSLSFVHNLKLFLEQADVKPEVEALLWAIMEQVNET